MRVLCVVGARPNFMKVAPILDALQARAVDTVLVHTGQHYDSSMSAVFFDDLCLRQPDHWLGVGSGSQAQQTAAVMTSFEPLLETIAPDVVVVVGDVNSTMAAALVTAKSSARLAHVEAGLRSGDWTMPEEVNRVVTDRVSDVLLSPSPDAVENLRAEGCSLDRVHLVGNVMIDTLLANLERAQNRPVLQRLGLGPGEYGVVTLHRPSNVDDDATFGALLSVLEKIAIECPLVFPAHPRAARLLATIGIPRGLLVTEPLGYLDFLGLEASARLVLTDSGGVQEETSVLGVPCLTLRDVTERPITVTEGTNTVVGRKPERILTEALRVLADGVPHRRPELWDGRASERIANVMVGLD